MDSSTETVAAVAAVHDWSLAKLKFLSDALQTAHTTALAGHSVTSKKIPHGNASVHFAALLHADTVMGPADSGNMSVIKNIVSSFGAAEAKDTCVLALALMKGMPLLAWAPTLCGTTGVPDFATILTCIGWDNTSDPAIYKRALSRLQAVVIICNHRWLLGSEYNTDDHTETRWTAAQGRVEQELERLTHLEGKLDDLSCIPMHVRDTLSETMRNLMPTPAAALAVAGPCGGTSFKAMVHSGLPAIVSMVHAHVVGDATVENKGAAFMLHMRLFLCNVSDQLALTMVRCDRMPALGPWYALIVLGVRSYACAVASIVHEDGKEKDDVEISYLILKMLALNDHASEYGTLSSPLENLLSTATRSSYESLGGQYGPYWVLCRAAFSGIQYTNTLAVAAMIHDTHAKNILELARFGSLCLLMHTQVAMSVLLHDPDQNGDRKNRISPMFKALCFLTMPSVKGEFGETCVHDQSVFEMITTFIAGSSDLEFLASDRATFVDTVNLELAWTEDLSLRKRRTDNSAAALPSNVEMQTRYMQTKPYLTSNEDSATVHGPPDDLYLDFVHQFSMIGIKWIAVVKAGDGDGDEDGDEDGKSVSQLLNTELMTQEIDAMGFGHVLGPDKSVKGLERRLQRVAASSVQSHCGAWLQMAMTFAVNLQMSSSFLIRPPEHVFREFGPKSMAVMRDSAWLRLNVRLQIARVLHMARYNGQIQRGNHLTIAAWFSTKSGPKLFARAITSHTLDNILYSSSDEPKGKEKCLLLSAQMRAEMRARGEDEILCMALEFVEEMQRVLEDECKDLSGDALTELKKGFPAMLDTSIDRRAAHVKIHGYSSWDVTSFDKASEVALSVFHKLRKVPKYKSNIHTTQSTFQHGCSVAVVSCPPEDLDFQTPQATSNMADLITEDAVTTAKAHKIMEDYASMDPLRGAETDAVEDVYAHRRQDERNVSAELVSLPEDWTVDTVEKIWDAMRGEKDHVLVRTISEPLQRVRNEHCTTEDIELAEAFGYETFENFKNACGIDDGALSNEEVEEYTTLVESVFNVLVASEDKKLEKLEFFTLLGSHPPPTKGSEEAQGCCPVHLALWTAFHALRDLY